MTNLRQRAKLAKSGFVRIDGLKIRPIFRGERSFILNTPANYFGKFFAGKLFMYIVTLDGEIWLGAASVTEKQKKLRRRLTDEFCPNSEAHLALPNLNDNHRIDTRLLLCRLMDPDFEA